MLRTRLSLLTPSAEPVRLAELIYHRVCPAMYPEGLARHQLIQTRPNAVTARLLKSPGFTMSEEQVVRFARTATKTDGMRS